VRSKFEYGSEAEAIELRKQAIDMPDGIRRDDLLRIARQIGSSPQPKHVEATRGLKGPWCQWSGCRTQTPSRCGQNRYLQANLRPITYAEETQVIVPAISSS
jgi:hypothetical protein